jgi:hypothetical protein
MADDDQLQFPPQRVVRHDAEIATDVGDDGADRAAADLGCDLLGRGQAGNSMRLSPSGKWITLVNMLLLKARKNSDLGNASSLEKKPFTPSLAMPSQMRSHRFRNGP